MAIISSQILNGDHADNQNAPNTQQPNTTPHEQVVSTETNQDLLSEIQAIKEAISNTENFDFSKLEAPAAGEADSAIHHAKSTSSSPILLNEDSLLIEYRSDSSSEQDSIQNRPDPDSSPRTDIDSTSYFLSESSPTEENQVQSNLSEDLITQTSGSFDANLNIQAQTITTEYGELVCHEDGSWNYTLNNQHNDIQSLSAGSSIEETISLESSTGANIELSFTINGSNDQAIITGQKQADIEALQLNELGNEHPSISGKLNVSDIDTGEARFETSFDIAGNFGTAQVNALGEWSYTLNNNSDAVQSLHSGEKIFDLFSVKTLDGTKQLIQISIHGVDDKPLLSGQNVAVLDLESNLNTQGSLTVNDPDFGESAFQAFSNIQSSLGYGTAEIDTQGNWSFILDSIFASQNTIDQGQTRIDSFEVFTVDGTSQTIHIPIQGSDAPLYARMNSNDLNSNNLSLDDVLVEAETSDILSTALNQHDNDTQIDYQNASNGHQQVDASIYMNTDASGIDQPINQNLNDIPIS